MKGKIIEGLAIAAFFGVCILNMMILDIMYGVTMEVFAYCQ